MLVHGTVCSGLCTAGAVSLTLVSEQSKIVVTVWLFVAHAPFDHNMYVVVQNVKVARLLISICPSLEACCSLVVVTHCCMLANIYRVSKPIKSA